MWILTVGSSGEPAAAVGSAGLSVIGDGVVCLGEWLGDNSAGFPESTSTGKDATDVEAIEGLPFTDDAEVTATSFKLVSVGVTERCSLCDGDIAAVLCSG